MNLLEQQLSILKNKHDLSEQCINEIRIQCCAHAINCSMDLQLLEQSSAWLVDQIISHIEQNIPLSAVDAVQQQPNIIENQTNQLQEKIATAEQMIKGAL